jgi:hypothetical protein
MSERIKQLAEQSNIRFGRMAILDGDPKGMARFVTYSEFEKFAELIVKDCIDKIETYRIPVGNSSAGELACEWTYDALKEIRDDIKEHFGLEE